MIFVLDASVAVKWVLAEPDSANALTLRADVQKQLHEILAPDIYPIEIAHGLTRAERKGIVPPGDAHQLLADILATPPQLHPHLPMLGRAVEISSQTGQGVYDCVYVALAEREGCEFLTADERLLRKLAGSFSFIRHLASI
jgi:predicted nucleic acid-binding protein